MLCYRQFIARTMEGEINGRRTRGKPCQSFFEKTFQQIGFNTYQQFNKSASDRYKWLNDF